MVWDKGPAGLVEMEHAVWGGTGGNKVVLYEESMEEEAAMGQLL